MSIVEISKSQIQEIKCGLEDSLNDESMPQRYTMRELIGIYFIEIEQLIKRFGAEKTVEILKGQNIEISTNTLKQYMSDFRKNSGVEAKKTTKPKQAKSTKKATKPKQTKSTVEADVISTPNMASEVNQVDEKVDDSANDLESNQPDKKDTIVSRLSGEKISQDDIMSEFNFVIN